jgi:hypothetical protein
MKHHNIDTTKPPKYLSMNPIVDKIMGTGDERFNIETATGKRRTERILLLL